MVDESKKRLVGWKAIGSHIGRDARTARRWEMERGLPVHRVPGGGSATVWADPEELTLWMKGNAEAEVFVPAAPTQAANTQATKRRWPWIVGAGAAVALALAAAAPFTSQPRDTALSYNMAPYGSDAEANDQFRLAKLAREKRTAQGLLKAATVFAQLTERYPKKPEAFVGLAETNFLLREFNSLPSEIAFRRAGMAAERALAIDPNSSEALRALAFIKYWSDAEPKKGLELFERSIKLDPNNSQTLHWYGNALMGEGRDKEVRDVLEKAYRLNPDSSAIAADRAMGLYLVGEKTKAVAALTSLTQVDPDFSLVHSHLERIYLLEGRDKEFLAAAERTARLKIQSDRLAAAIAARTAFETGGRKAMLASLIKSEQEKFAQDGESAIRVAILHRAAGDAKGALQWLMTARALHEPGIDVLAAYPEFIPYRTYPAFKSFF